MGRPRTKLRTPAQRADYAELMRQVRELQARRRQSDIQRLNGLMLEYAASKAMKVLIDAFAGCRTLAEAHALAVMLMEPDDA